MDKYKCRAKRLDNGYWVYGYIVEWEAPLEICKREPSTWFIAKTSFSDWNMPREIDFTPVDPETIERFTCFHDKNDHEIYEGNICTRKVQQSDYYPADVYAPEHPETKRWVEVQKGIITMQPEVRFNNEFICHKLWKEEELEPRQAVSAWDYEIIGDIHDNPEIMTLNAY